MEKEKFIEREWTPEIEGRLDDDGFFITPNGSFWDPDYVYFNRKGFDKHGGRYDESGEYKPGEGWDEELNCYESEKEDNYFKDEEDELDNEEGINDQDAVDDFGMDDDDFDLLEGQDITKLDPSIEVETIVQKHPEFNNEEQEEEVNEINEANEDEKEEKEVKNDNEDKKDEENKNNKEEEKIEDKIEDKKDEQKNETDNNKPKERIFTIKTKDNDTIIIKADDKKDNKNDNFKKKDNYYDYKKQNNPHYKKGNNYHQKQKNNQNNRPYKTYNDFSNLPPNPNNGAPDS